MSTSKLVTVWCDFEGCQEWTTDGTSWTVGEARVAARRAGWRYVPGRPAEGPGRDFCPAHRDSEVAS